MASAPAAVAAAKVNLKPVNRAAVRRYQQFWRSLTALDFALSEVRKLIAAAGDTKGDFSYRVPDAEELMRAQKKVERSIQAMISESKRWEAELISREWW